MKEFSNLDILECAPSFLINAQQFEYGSSKGYAKTIGWQIIFFSKEQTFENVIAISIEDVLDDPDLLKIANKIVQQMGVSVKMGDSLKLLETNLGEPYRKVENIEGVINYYFLNNNIGMLNIGTDDDNKIVSLEWVGDKRIIEERFESLK